MTAFPGSAPIPHMTLPAGAVVKDQKGTAPLRQNMNFVNGLSKPVTIGFRNGVKFWLPRTPGVRTPHLVTSIEIFNNPVVNLDLGDLSDDYGNRTSPNAKFFEESFFRESSPLVGGIQGGHAFSYRISVNELDAMGGIVYVPELDVVVSVLDPANTPPHPYSIKGQLRAQSQPELAAIAQGLSYRLRIVDNARRYGRRYANINGEVYAIEPEVDLEAFEGVYLISNMPSSIGGRGLPRAVYYNFEEADKALGLYKTPDDALTLGDPGSILSQRTMELKRKVLENEESLRESRHQNEIEKLKYEREVQEAKREAERLAREVERIRHDNEQTETRYKRELADLKHRYGIDESNRKEVMDIVKQIPALVGAAWSVYKVFEKIKK